MKVLFVQQGFATLGIEYLSASLRARGHSTELLFDPVLFDDCFVVRPRLARLFSLRAQLERRARESASGAGLAAFSVITPKFLWALETARWVKAELGLKTVFGGLHPSAVPEEVMKRPEVDFVIAGEGDEAIAALAGCLESGGDLSKVPRLLWRRDGEVVRNPLGSFIQDLDTLPFPDKDLFYREADYFDFGYTAATSRGCHLRCTFCCNNFVAHLSDDGDKGFLRRRSVGNAVEELSRAKKRWRPAFVRFYDDCFTLNPPWLREFRDAYRREVSLPFWCFTNPDAVTPEVVGLLEEAGCYEVQMGVQTFSEKLRRDVLGRFDTNEDVRRAIQLFRGSRISLATDNILNVPGQTAEELADMAVFYSENRVGRVNLYWLAYYPGTEMMRIGKKMGTLSSEREAALIGGTQMRAVQADSPADRPDLMRLHFFLIVSQFLPHRVNEWIRRKRLYRFFPSVDALLLFGIAYRLRATNQYSVLEHMLLRRYWDYGWRKILGGRRRARAARPA